MPNRPQFSLKAILIFTAVLSVPLAMIATRDKATGPLGILLLFPVLGGYAGYFVGGRRRAGDGIAIGIIIGLSFAFLLLFVWTVHT